MAKGNEKRKSKKHMITSIGSSSNTRYKSKNKRRMKKRYRGQGR